VARLGLKYRFTWLPFQEDIREIETAADILVLPSDEEALGLCIMEAMSLAIPVVVSDSGGSTELIENGISGLTMSGGDAASLADCMRHLAQNVTLRGEMGRNARLRIRTMFSLEKHAAQVGHFLTMLLSV